MTESELNKKAQKGYLQEFDSLDNNRQFLERLKAENKSEKSFFPLWISKPIPAYSLALASLLFLILFSLKEPKKTELIVYRDAEPIIQCDTIVVRDTLIIESTFEKRPRKRLVKNTQKSRSGKSSASTQTVISEGEFYFDASQVSEQQNLTGSSSADSELAQFLGVGI
ncbi:MAG: hypothetical protein ABF242_08865 [Flavobacteriales bacterium]